MLIGPHLRIDLGSGDPKDGESSPEGYLKQDADPKIAGLDIVCDILLLDKHIAPNSCAKLRASHVLEHFGIHEQDTLFAMLYALLEPGGEIEIIVPNFKWHAQLVLAGQEEDAVYYAFGGQLDPYDFHKYGFTPTILFKKLMKAGFKDIQIEDESSIVATARKR